MATTTKLKKDMSQFVVPEDKSPRGFILNPKSVGAVISAVAAAYPCTPRPDDYLEGIVEPDQWAEFEDSFVLAFRVTSAILGFMVGYGVAMAMGWLRWKAISILLSYRDWMYLPNAPTTKAWGLALTLLEGPGPYYTFYFQDALPKQPVPDLDKTLNRYLQTSKNYVTEEEFKETKKAVEQFRVQEGPRLQAYLSKRGEEGDSWLADYWKDAAYLCRREPLPLNSNYVFNNKIQPQVTTNPLARATIGIHSMVEYAEFLAENRVPAVVAGGCVPLCMEPYRSVFNTVRIPKEERDEMREYVGEKYMVIMRNGHYFKLDLYAEDETGKETALSRAEIRQQLQHIHDITESIEFGTEVAALTTLDRPTWAKLRETLLENEINRKTVEVIDKSMGLLVLDMHCYKDKSEQIRMALSGDGTNRWFDKNFNFILFTDASLAVNIEHTGIDAMVFSTMCDYMFHNEYNGGFDKDGEIMYRSSESYRKLPPPDLLQWDLGYMHQAITEAKDTYLKWSETLESNVVNLPYGKGFMKKRKISPDSYIQMALQLAYYRLHKTTCKTYEPATLRMFKLGRTDTIHSVSDHSIAWVKAMDSSNVLNSHKAELLKKAMEHHKQFSTDATAGRGCDRHMMALNCAAKQLCREQPVIFKDKAFNVPFLMSTSTIPVNYIKHNPNLELTAVVGAFAPVDHDGYGMCYVHHGDYISNIHISAWKTCPKTDANKFGDEVIKAMNDMRHIMS